MLSGKVKYYSLLSGFALAAAFTLTACPSSALGQTTGTADNAVGETGLVATKATAGSTARKAMWSPRDQDKDKDKAKAKSGFWGGFYIGAFGGGVFNRSNAAMTAVGTASDYLATTTPAAIASLSAQKINNKVGYGGGGGLGFARQSGNLVYGGEADFGVMRANKTVSSTAILPCCGTATFTITQTVKTRYLLTARPRIGYGSVDKLFYATGGLAVTGINYDGAYTDTLAGATESGSISKKRYGWTAGGGVEIKIASKWSVKGEYLYASFGTVTTTSTNLMARTPTVAYPANIFTHSTDLISHNIRYGINYHF